MSEQDFKVGDRVFIIDNGTVHLGMVTSLDCYITSCYYVKRDGLSTPQIETKHHIYHYPEDVLKVENQLVDEVMYAEMSLGEFREEYYELIDDKRRIRS